MDEALLKDFRQIPRSVVTAMHRKASTLPTLEERGGAHALAGWVAIMSDPQANTALLDATKTKKGKGVHGS